MFSDPGRTLEALGYAVDPMSAPLSYPGRPPEGLAALLTGRCLLDIQPAAEPMHRWLVGGRTLESALVELQAAPLSARHPVLAVGSNASPAQLARKFARAEPAHSEPGWPARAEPSRPGRAEPVGPGRPEPSRPGRAEPVGPGRAEPVGPGAVVPMTAVRVEGLAVGVSAHVGRFGYVPATPVPGPAAESKLWVTWLDDAQLVTLDAIEPNYHRVAVPTADQVSAPMPNGVSLPIPHGGGCWMYVSRHGHLTNRDGTPRRLGTQAELLWGLLNDIPALAAMAGADPVTIAAAARADPELRDRIRRLFRAEGLVSPGWRR